MAMESDIIPKRVFISVVLVSFKCSQMTIKKNRPKISTAQRMYGQHALRMKVAVLLPKQSLGTFIICKKSRLKYVKKLNQALSLSSIETPYTALNEDIT
mmetsp:Transcript_18671/g.27654  ORF Transcript_18671/g.27654 Transcript_18671/m.27654 type:complete len:99 (+) Transcript_18671:652-948(+)